MTAFATPRHRCPLGGTPILCEVEQVAERLIQIVVIEGPPRGWHRAEGHSTCG